MMFNFTTEKDITLESDDDFLNAIDIEKTAPEALAALGQKDPTRNWQKMFDAVLADNRLNASRILVRITDQFGTPIYTK